MERPLFDQILSKGREQGRQAGYEEGFQKGLEKGRLEGLAAMQEAVLELLRDRLEVLDVSTEAAIRSVDDFDPLTYLLIDLGRATHPDEVQALVTRVARSRPPK